MLTSPGQFVGKRRQQWRMNLAAQDSSDHLSVSAVVLVGRSIK